MKITRFSSVAAASTASGGGGGGGGSGGGGGGGSVGGDLSGSSVSPQVVGIRGKPISTDAPVSGDVLTFDGTQWAPAAGGSSSDGMVPYYIPTDETFTVPLYKQALFKTTIEVDGILVVLGQLLGVD